MKTPAGRPCCRRSAEGVNELHPVGRMGVFLVIVACVGVIWKEYGADRRSNGFPIDGARSEQSSAFGKTSTNDILSERETKAELDAAGRFDFPQESEVEEDFINTREMRAFLEVQCRVAIDRSYGSLIHELGLSSKQAEALKALLVEREIVVVDIAKVSEEMGGGLRFGSDDFRKLTAAAQQGIDDSIRALLGDGGLDFIRSFEATLPQRVVVAELQQRLAPTEAPLSADQASQLAELLAEHAEKVGDGPSGEQSQSGGEATATASAYAALLSGELYRNSIPIATAAISQAWGFLSQPQIQELQQLQVQQNEKKAWRDNLAGYVAGNARGRFEEPSPRQ